MSEAHLKQKACIHDSIAVLAHSEQGLNPKPLNPAPFALHPEPNAQHFPEPLKVSPPVACSAARLLEGAGKAASASFGLGFGV